MHADNRQGCKHNSRRNSQPSSIITCSISGTPTEPEETSKADGVKMGSSVESRAQWLISQQGRSAYRVKLTSFAYGRCIVGLRNSLSARARTVRLASGSFS